VRGDLGLRVSEDGRADLRNRYSVWLI